MRVRHAPLVLLALLLAPAALAAPATLSGATPETFAPGVAQTLVFDAAPGDLPAEAVVEQWDASGSRLVEATAQPLFHEDGRLVLRAAWTQPGLYQIRIREDYVASVAVLTGEAATAEGLAPASAPRPLAAWVVPLGVVALAFLARRLDRPTR